MNQNDIERFVEAQNKSYEGYQTALAELRAGEKKSHWIWYVFPSMRPDKKFGSPTTQFYGISDDAEALRYLHHPILGPRLAEITAVVHLHLIEKKDKEVTRLMSNIDDIKKLRSCMKLFMRVGADADASTLPWLTTFLAHANAIFHLIDKPEYRHR